ncbi:unnamed protein product [Pseudo-nitzschia multistriata]|uniref:Uncharacterized protein n=1 Tax=Pseudo-nitzschia multistriata TaxID=183589 RepID=A0A448Z996_9STRA|nr:unnamed protein product [Pseudo-nitzschia multistriata]
MPSTRKPVITSVLLGIVVAFCAMPRASLGFSTGHLQNTFEKNQGSKGEQAGPRGAETNGGSRRGFLEAASASTASAWLLPLAVGGTAAAPPARAFDNRLDDRYASAIPQTGTQPPDLGHSQRSNYFGLKSCGNSPNCWNSSAPKANIPARWLPAWEAPKGSSIADVKKVVDTYEVGQNNVDGGGFRVMEYTNSSSEQYLYVQFQSYKAGYIDDFECWFNPESQKFDVRSSSRVGYSDLGVNAIRLEYIANRLETEYGWTFERRKNGKLV